MINNTKKKIIYILLYKKLFRLEIPPVRSESAFSTTIVIITLVCFAQTRTPMTEIQ